MAAATVSAADQLRTLGVSASHGLSAAEVTRRRAEFGPNAVSSHRARFLPVLWYQLRSPLLVLLVGAAVASFFVGERSGALIIGAIVALSVGLGFVTSTGRRRPRRPCTRRSPTRPSSSATPHRCRSM